MRRPRVKPSAPSTHSGPVAIRLPDTIPAFVPAWWCRSGHAQTVWAAMPRPTGLMYRRERWDTPDGDFLDIDCLPSDPGRPAVLVLHGLEGSSRSQQIRDLLRAAYQRRWHAYALNFRSCSGVPNRSRRFYHGGETSDLGWVLERLRERHPTQPICGIGVSLGGNVLLKYLGEQGEAPPVIAAAVAVSVPFELAASAEALEGDVFTRLYMRRMLRSLKRKVAAKLAQYPGLVDPERVALIRTIREFDEIVTAPLSGFASAQAYWTASSSRAFLGAIRRPTLLINALDDPLVPAQVLPRQEIAANAALSAAFPEGGGHVGFIAGDRPTHPFLWLGQAVFGFFEHCATTHSS